jgi:hypothetical protein
MGHHETVVKSSWAHLVSLTKQSNLCFSHAGPTVVLTPPLFLTRHPRLPSPIRTTGPPPKSVTADPAAGRSNAVSHDRTPAVAGRFHRRISAVPSIPLGPPSPKP